MRPKYIDKTHYFKKPSSWFKRILITGLLLALIVIMNLQNDALQILLITTVVIIGVIYRKDDLALDDKYFYYLRTSIIPLLSKVEKFQISEIASIRYKGYESWIWTIKGGKTLKGTQSGIEMTFKNNESTSLDVRIYKKDMAKIIEKVKARMDRDGA